MLSYIFRDDEVIVVLDGVPYIVSIDDDRYEEVVDAIDDGNKELLHTILSQSSRASQLSAELTNAEITQVGGRFAYNGTPINMELSDYLSAAIERGTATHIVNFIKNLFNNPNHQTREHLFAFMDHNKMTISPDGCFTAYKVVCHDYMDKHSRTMRNAPGDTLSVGWDKVDTDPDKTCSQGLHVCSHEYVSSFRSGNDRVVSVKVNPADVGAVPRDYNGSKIRTRGYTVLHDITDMVESATPNRVPIQDGLTLGGVRRNLQRDYF